MLYWSQKGGDFMKIYTEKQMRAAEKTAADAGMAYLRLMENAGSACSAQIKKRVRRDRKVAVLCGKGKNGGDGFVIARKLSEDGFAVAVLLVFGAPKDADAAFMFSKLSGTQVKVFDLTQNDAPKRLIPEADVLVDAVFGIGFRGLPQVYGIESSCIIISRMQIQYAILIVIQSGGLFRSYRRLYIA